MQHPAQRLSLILVRRMTNQQWIKTICAEGSGLLIDRTSGAPGRWSAYQKLPNSWSKAIPLFSIALASLFRSSLVARAPCRVGHFALSELNIVVIYDLDRLPHVSRKSGKPPSNVMASASLKSAACHLFIIDDQTKIIDDQTKMATVRRLPASFSAER